MPPRLSKRQQRELEELQALQTSPAVEPEADENEESEFEAAKVPVKAAAGSGFAAVSRKFCCCYTRLKIL